MRASVGVMTACCVSVCFFCFLFVVVVVVLIMISCHFTPLLQCVNTSCMGAIQQWREWLEKFHRCYIFFYHIWVLTWVGFLTLYRGQTGCEGWWEIRKGRRRSREIAEAVSTAGGPRLAGAMCPSTSEAQWPPLTCRLAVSAANRSDFEITLSFFFFF